MTTYPPERHLLRDLQLTFDHSSASASRAWMPVVPEICGEDGSVRAGALTTLVDVIGGGLAATAAHPNWIATADLTLHLTAAATAGDVEARARLLRAGRTTLVLEVTLHNNPASGAGVAAAATPIGIATMSFAVLPRRDINPDVTETRTGGPSTMALESSALAGPLLELVGIETVDAAAGIVELPVREWAMNSMGALQGGIVGAVVEAAAEVALQAATDRPLVVTDVQLTYLAFGKVGPLRTRVDVIERNAARAVARVGLVDVGAAGRQMAIARAGRDEVTRMTQSPANMGTDIMRFARLDLREVEELCIEGEARTVDHLRGRDGAVRAGALLTMLDSAGGVCGGLASLPDGWVVSTNLCARTVHHAPTGPLRIGSRVLRKGRNNVVTAVEIADAATGTLVMDGVLTSAILVPENGPPVWERPLRIGYPGDVDFLSMDRWLDARVVDARALEMDLRDTLRNPWGILHGGVTAALVDACVEHATAGGRVTDVVLHYLAPNRTGPVRATASILGHRSDGDVVRVEVLDAAEGRVTAVAVVTAARD